MKCGENMEYKPCGDPCLPTCADRAGENCGDLGPCSEGCFCKKGFVYDGKSECIPESDCGCEVPSLGIYINVSMDQLEYYVTYETGHQINVKQRSFNSGHILF